MISMERIALENVPWQDLDQFSDRNIFQTSPWLKFVAKTQGAEPVAAIIKEDSQLVGYFTGLIVTKFGLKILGSPFKGWTTAYMGFNLLPDFPRRKVLEMFPTFAFNELGCHYLELVDRYLGQEDYCNQAYEVEGLQIFEIDLSQSEAQLFANMDGACRRCIRKAAKCGITIEEAFDIGFADDYYAQLGDVFAKQALVPTYGVGRVRELIRFLLPTENLLLLRARTPEGLCIATGIFPAFNDTAYFFGGASWREHQNLRPNEPLLWYAMNYWKARGMKKFDMGGKASYKRKYGGYEIEVPSLKKARYNSLFLLRNLAQQVWKVRQGALGRVKQTHSTR